MLKTRKEFHDKCKHDLFYQCMRRVEGMHFRCMNNPYYINKGIQVNITLGELFDWVFRQGLSVEDIRWKHIHRIDPEGDYEVGNIEFLTPSEHRRKHSELRRAKKLKIEKLGENEK